MSSEQTAVTRWFGPHFQDLHPRLQELHRHGGVLEGVVEIRTGTGLAGWLGRRLAASLGIPVDRARRRLRVEVQHRGAAMFWLRRFDNGGELASCFEPVGTWPHGYWKEATGRLQMRLTVNVVDQGWQWRPLRATLHGIPLPMWLLPVSSAGKRIADDKYVFHVEFTLPLVGRILMYGGALECRSPESVACG